jgi:hypothetical protein
MSALIELKKLARMIQRMSEPAAMLAWRKCQIIGAIQRSQDGKAKAGKRMAGG